MTEDARLKVFWVPAISHASFELAYREIGQRLRIPGIDDDNVDVKTLVRDRLSLPSAGDWIIVVDNADDSDVLFGAVGEQKSTNLIDWLPRSSRGSILFTTRNSKMAARLTLGNQNIYLAKLGTTEAGEMLKRRITKEHLIGDETTVNELLEKLDCLPLAITQATAFINTNEVTVARYLRLFQDTSAAEIFSKKFYDNSRYGSESNVDYDGMDSTIAKTWHISFEQMRKQDPLAAEYLSFMACIDRINIPESILPLERSNTLDHLESIGTLIGYAFITRQQQTHGTGREDLYDMHRLVHMACVLWLDAHEERAPWSSKALDRLIDVVPRKGHEGRQVWILYLPHAIYVADHNPTMTDQLKAAILNRVGRCQATLGQYSAAEATHRQALQLRKKSLGEDSAFTLASMAELGQALLHQGKYAEAEAIDQQAVAGRKKVLGLEDPFTLQAMNNLAAVLRYRGKLEAAELMYTEILEVQTRVCGPQHSDTLSSKLNLGLVLKDRGKLKEAESFDREALQGWERLHGRDHPNTMTALNNLAAVLNSQGKKEEATAFAEEGFQRTMDALGEDHSETLISLNNVACMTPTGPKCELMWRDLLERRTKVLGEEHPDTITTMINLADVLDELEKDEGEEMGKKALALREKVLGFEHPDTMLCAWGLATILAHGYKFEEATVLYQRAYSGLSAKLGKDHSSTRGCRKEWDDMLAVQDSLRSPISKLTSGVKNFSFGSFKPFARQKV
jgi:tetratricopeptide (TPR) repeat protein